MSKLGYVLLVVGFCSFLATDVSAQSCSNFRHCDNLGKAAQKAGNPALAQQYYREACFVEVAQSLVNLRSNACRAVTTISGELDSYTSADLFFSQACNGGVDAGCFHLALLENDRGNLQRAMEIMKPLCDRDYIIHKNVWSSGCNEYEQMVRTWEIQYPPPPRQPRDNAIQIPIFLMTLLLPLIAAVFLGLKRYYVSLTLSGCTFFSYGFYEYGVSPYASIRIDLLILLPLLLLALVIFIAGIVLIFKKSRLA